MNYCEKALVFSARCAIVSTLRQVGLWVAIQSTFLGFSWAGDVYSSTDPAGQLRWSTQALDSSYKLEPALTTLTPTPTSQHNGAVGSSTQVSAKQLALDQRRLTYRPMVETIARRHGVSSLLVMALIEVESNFNPRAISTKGARGLMQLLPSTAAAYGLRHAQELFDPARNIDIGSRHLKALLEKHEGQWALTMASYNAGLNAVSRHGNRIPNYRETMLYVPAVLAIASQLVDPVDTTLVGNPEHEKPED